jgi:hypothetical protein
MLTLKLFIVAIILFIVTACITIALTYFQLSMEDHRWWWSSFLNGGYVPISDFKLFGTQYDDNTFTIEPCMIYVIIPIHASPSEI